MEVKCANREHLLRLHTCFKQEDTYKRKEGAMSRQQDDTKNVAVEAACFYLRSHEAEVIETGYVCEAGSVDLVYREEGTLVFALVRASAGPTLPDDNLDASDRVRLEMIAISYLSNHDLPSSRIRFDTICMAVVGEGRMMRCHHRDALGQSREQHIDRSGEAAHIKAEGAKQPAKQKKSKGRER